MCAIHLALTQMFSKGSAVLLYSQNETETNELSAGYEISLMNLRMILHTGFCSGMVRTRLNRLIRELGGSFKRGTLRVFGRGFWNEMSLLCLPSDRGVIHDGHIGKVSSLGVEIG